MDVAGKLKGFCENYFHFEPSKTRMDKALNGIKLVSFILVIFPIIAGITLGVTTLILKNRKIVPLNLNHNNQAKVIDDLAREVIDSSDDSDSDDDSDFDDHDGQISSKEYHYFNKPVLRDVLSNIILPKLETKDLMALSETSRSLAKKTEPERDKRWASVRDPITFGKEQWQEVGVDVEDVPELSEDIDAILKGLCPFHEGKRVYQTHRLVLIPSNVSINQLGILMKHLRDGDDPNVYESFWDELVQQKGDVVVKKSYWALVTCDAIPGSRRKKAEDLIVLIKKYPYYRLSFMLEEIALVTMNRKCRNKFLLFQKYPSIYTGGVVGLRKFC